MSKYRIHWQSLKTGETGNGTSTFNKEMAQDIARKLNRVRKYRMIHYWIVEVKSD